MIRSFRCEETRGIFELRRSRRLPGAIQQMALRKLRMLNRSASLEDLRVPPANRLEKSPAIEKDNGASGSTINGVSASNGTTATLTKSK